MPWVSPRRELESRRGGPLVVDGLVPARRARPHAAGGRARQRLPAAGRGRRRPPAPLRRRRTHGARGPSRDPGDPRRAHVPPRRLRRHRASALEAEPRARPRLPRHRLLRQAGPSLHAPLLRGHARALPRRRRSRARDPRGGEPRRQPRAPARPPLPGALPDAGGVGAGGRVGAPTAARLGHAEPGRARALLAHRLGPVPLLVLRRLPRPRRRARGHLRLLRRDHEPGLRAHVLGDRHRPGGFEPLRHRARDTTARPAPLGRSGQRGEHGSRRGTAPQAPAAQRAARLQGRAPLHRDRDPGPAGGHHRRVRLPAQGQDPLTGWASLPG